MLRFVSMHHQPLTQIGKQLYRAQNMNMKLEKQQPNTAFCLGPQQTHAHRQIIDPVHSKIADYH